MIIFMMIFIGYWFGLITIFCILIVFINFKLANYTAKYSGQAFKYGDERIKFLMK